MTYEKLKLEADKLGYVLLKEYFIAEDKTPNGKTWYNVCRIDTSCCVIEKQCGTMEEAEKQLKEINK